MPITKKQSDVPGVSEEEALEQNKIDQEEKVRREEEALESGHIPQVSSAVLHNYPDAKVPMAEEPPEQQRTPQPKTGASAIAKEE